VFASQEKIAQTAVLTVALVHHLSLPVNPLMPMWSQIQSFKTTLWFSISLRIRATLGLGSTLVEGRQIAIWI
jgi:hypothetical protein